MLKAARSRTIAAEAEKKKKEIQKWSRTARQMNDFCFFFGGQKSHQKLNFPIGIIKRKINTKKAKMEKKRKREIKEQSPKAKAEAFDNYQKLAMALR